MNQFTDAASAQAAATQAAAGITAAGFTVTSVSLTQDNSLYAVRAVHTSGWIYETTLAAAIPDLIAACNSH